MLLPIKWLKEYVTVKQTPAQVAEVLTLAGFEVERIIPPNHALDAVVVGEIKTIIDHAEADRLCVCTVAIGKRGTETIVCGAKNIKPGDKVPVALPGTTLPNGMTIEKRMIRGIESHGMLCAADELGLGDDHGGIFILDASAPLGQKLPVTLGLHDAVLDINVPPQRADAQSLIGMAREYAALTNQTVKLPKVTIAEAKGRQQKFTVKVRDTVGCPKYTARVLRNITVGPSPVWLQNRLRAAGHTPINNIVDVTNFVMLEMGQPMHAFDAEHIEGHTIIVKTAGRAQSFVTLDGVERKLPSTALMINDAKKTLAIAGIMGGQQTAISNKTKTIVLESAIFKPLSVRITRQHLSLATDASMRFERCIWWGLPEAALDRATQLIQECAGGVVASPRIIVARQPVEKSKTVAVNPETIRQLIGTAIADAVMQKSLERLGFVVAVKRPDQWQVSAPAWRSDIHLMADVVEEIGRSYGWNRLAAKPLAHASQPVAHAPEFLARRRVVNILRACDLIETYNYSTYGADVIEQFDWETKDHYQVMNPMNAEQAYLRMSLVPGLYLNLLQTYQERPQLQLTEIGRVFYKTNRPMPEERVMIAALLYDRTAKRGTPGPIHELQGIIQTLVKELGISLNELQFAVNSDRARVVDVMLGGSIIGWYGWLIQHEQKLGVPPVWFEIDLAKLMSHVPAVRRYQPIVNYPSVIRDMTFATPIAVSFFKMRDAIQNMSPLIQSVEARAVYPLDEATRRATIRIKYQSAERTLHTDDVDSLQTKIVSMMEHHFQAILAEK
ncbi:MAG: phenylalanine--tRNA ligase subunit beta [Candidatus Kerfeldbacteria bacterium]|nr:phenylalanine--tRNA ligase subunit beta [Candidatus Kerfeldbacteria bacterium]